MDGSLRRFLALSLLLHAGAFLAWPAARAPLPALAGAPLNLTLQSGIGVRGASSGAGVQDGSGRTSEMAAHGNGAGTVFSEVGPEDGSRPVSGKGARTAERSETGGQSRIVSTGSRSASRYRENAAIAVLPPAALVENGSGSTVSRDGQSESGPGPAPSRLPAAPRQRQEPASLADSFPPGRKEDGRDEAGHLALAGPDTAAADGPGPAGPAPVAAAGLTPGQLAARLHEAAEMHFYYPPLARRLGWEGDVRLALRVEHDGRLSAIRVLSSSGYRVLDSAAVDSLTRLARLPDAAGVPLSGMETVLPVRYRLLDESGAGPPFARGSNGSLSATQG